MRCPTLKELPQPPKGETVWPWTEESHQLPDTMPDGSPWPKISIVTPSLNQGQYIEETIRSVLLQGYPNLEYIIIDGGSKDSSVDIIKRYEPWLTYWISETDDGQANAINKGFKISTGEIVAWLNSDDYYLRNIFNRLIKFIIKNTTIDLFYGDLLLLHEKTKKTEIVKARPFNLADQVRHKIIMQPTCFWRNNLFKKIGYLNETYENIFDVEYFIRASFSIKPKYFPCTLSCFRIQPEAKTQKNSILTTLEGIRMYRHILSQNYLPKNISELKGEIFEHWYERLALHHFVNKSYKLARKWFLKAFIASPWRIQNLYLIIFIIDTYLQTNISRKIRKLRMNK